MSLSDADYSMGVGPGSQLFVVLRQTRDEEAAAVAAAAAAAAAYAAHTAAAAAAAAAATQCFVSHSHCRYLYMVSQVRQKRTRDLNVVRVRKARDIKTFLFVAAEH